MEKVFIRNAQKKISQSSKSFWLRLGFTCNSKCVMCYFFDKLGTIDLSTEEVKKYILLAKKKDASVLTLTGGEPTMRKDFLYLLSYANKIGIPFIVVQTNGRMFYYEEFVKKISNIEKRNTDLEFLIPIYGHNERVHDAITMSPGSFKQTVQGIKNLLKYEQRFIAKTVMMKSNYRHLPDTVKLLTDLNVKNISITSVCIPESAGKNIKGVVPRFKEAIPYLYKALETLDRKKLKITLSSIPLCLIRKYENFVDEKIKFKSILIKDPDEEVKVKRIPKNATRNFRSKTKLEKCRKCRLFSKCGGVWKEYVKMYGEDEFIPVI